MNDGLPDGLYPFADKMLPLSQLAMSEAPRALEALLRKSAAESRVEIYRDRLIELTCASEDFPEARFMVFWPSGNERLHILAPVESISGRA